MSNGFQSVAFDDNSSTIHYFGVAQAFLKNNLLVVAHIKQWFSSTDLPRKELQYGGANPPDNHQHDWGLIRQVVAHRCG